MENSSLDNSTDDDPVVSRYDILFTGDKFVLVQHRCLMGMCYGTNTGHGFSLEEAKQVLESLGMISPQEESQ